MVIEALNILENFDLASSVPPQSARSIHLIASALQLAFADRAQYMGDPDYARVPLRQLLSKPYAARQSRRIDSTPSSSVDRRVSGRSNRAESPSTTHFSIMDEQGNVVSTTQTINGHFGSGITVPGTGIVLNNEMDDFSVKPGVGNIYGAVGGQANEIAPGKTPLSSMSPTIVLRDNKPLMAIGAPGGTRIISCVTGASLNYLFEYGMTLYDSVDAIRIHHQWKPDELLMGSPRLALQAPFSTSFGTWAMRHKSFLMEWNAGLWR